MAARGQLLKEKREKREPSPQPVQGNFPKKQRINAWVTTADGLMPLVQDQKLRICYVALCRFFLGKILPVLAIFAAFFSLFLLNGGLLYN